MKIVYLKASVSSAKTNILFDGDNLLNAKVVIFL